jgi:hypothetical protein
MDNYPLSTINYHLPTNQDTPPTIAPNGTPITAPIKAPATQFGNLSVEGTNIKKGAHIIAMMIAQKHAPLIAIPAVSLKPAPNTPKIDPTKTDVPVAYNVPTTPKNTAIRPVCIISGGFPSGGNNPTKPPNTPKITAIRNILGLIGSTTRKLNSTGWLGTWNEYELLDGRGV